MVRIERGTLKKRTDVIHGLVKSLGPEWVLIVAMDDSIYFDGWEIVRTRDITSVTSPDQTQSTYLARAIAVTGSGPPVPAALTAAIAGTGNKALRDVLRAEVLCALYLEERWSDSLFAGTFERWNKRKIAFRQIDTAGHWREEASIIKASSITRVTIGSRYLNGLEQFGDRAPVSL